MTALANLTHEKLVEEGKDVGAAHDCDAFFSIREISDKAEECWREILGEDEYKPVSSEGAMVQTMPAGSRLGTWL